jgi:hypothetical protein
VERDRAGRWQFRILDALDSHPPQNDTSARFYGNPSTDPVFEILRTVFPEVNKPYAVPDTDDLERWFRLETHIKFR